MQVQEVEEKVDDCVESLAEEATTHQNHKEVDIINIGEDKREPTKEGNIDEAPTH